MKTIIYITSALVFLLPALSLGDSKKYPPLEAIQLVVEKDIDTLKKLDGGEWEVDLKNREWTVQRTVEPGYLDTTRVLAVIYRVEGKTVACWAVDLEAKVVQKLGRKFCGP